MLFQISESGVDPRERTEQEPSQQPETLDASATETDEEETDTDDHELSEGEMDDDDE